MSELYAEGVRVAERARRARELLEAARKDLAARPVALHPHALCTSARKRKVMPRRAA